MNGRRFIRYIWFVISIVAGLALGLLAGWSRSLDIVNASPATLRQDFQLDIVLMVAEIYHQDSNLPDAQRRLAFLDPDDSLRFVQQAALDAHELGYTTDDLALIVALAQALEPGVHFTSQPTTGLTAQPTIELTAGLTIEPTADLTGQATTEPTQGVTP